MTRNFLFVSLEGLITDIAWQVTREGHGVRYFIQNPEERELGDGFVEKTDDWERELDWADVIVFDDVLGQGKEAERLRSEGRKVIGGTEYTDRLEDERGFGQEELKNHGISIIPYREFDSFIEAIDFVKSNPDQYVLKPSGQAQNVKGLLFVGEERDGRDVTQVLEAYRQAWEKKIPVFQLQKRVVGVEVAVGAFFNGKKFLEPINVNFEHKKLFPGDLGPSTGEMGTAMFWSSPNKIFNATLKKFEGTFEKEGYVGYVDLNCIVNSHGVYPLEWTARFGYPTISIQQEGMITPIGELLFDLASGSSFEFETRKGFQVGVRIVVPPFPFEDRETFRVKSKDSIIYFTEEPKGVHLEDVKKVDEEWVITGTSGVALIVCGTGPTMRSAQKQVYSRLSKVLIPNMYYRKDVGDRWFEDSDRMHTWGYLREI